MNNQEFFNLLFDEDEKTCFAKFPGGTKVYSIDSHPTVGSFAQFFCINPLHPTQDLNPTENYHSSDLPRRADANVIKYRNILIEMDDLSLEDQVKVIKESNFPYSTATYSGGKSIHFIISLEDPVATISEYKRLVERVQQALGGKGVVDLANKNPSRLSRFPNVMRQDKDKFQKLLKIQGRIKFSVLNEWLLSRGVPEQVESTYVPDMTISKDKHMSGFTMNFIMMGGVPGERNQSLFKAACDLARCGYELDECFDMLIQASGLTPSEARTTIRSAYNKVTLLQK